MKKISRKAESYRWDEIFRAGKFPLLNPHPVLISLLPIFEQRGIHRICDLGCGTGRNLLLLAQRRFELYGIDISVEGLRQTHRNLDEFDFKVNLVQSDMTNIPYKNSVFDSVICVYAIYHNTLENIRKTLAEIYRILNEGGFVYITFQSLRSYKYGKGRFVEVNTFVQDFPPEQDIPHHFSDEGEVQQLMQAFHIIKIELDEYKSENGRTHSHWQVLAEKEH